MIGFRSNITKKALGYFFANPSKKHYINELAEILGVDLGNLYRKLKELENSGILMSENVGRQKYFSLNKKSPLLNAVKKTFEAEFGVEKTIKKALSKLEGLQDSYIFGSFASGKMSSESDIDILLVGSHSSLDAKRLLLPLQKKLGRELNIVDMTTEDLRKRRKMKDDFLKNVFSKKIIDLKYV